MTSSTVSCPGAEIGEDGLCIHCGRRARLEDWSGKVNVLRGRPVHVRGRQRGKVYARPPASTSSEIRNPTPPRLPRRLKPVRRDRCPDCEAVLQPATSRGLRWLQCPWSTSRRALFSNGVVACGWPKGEKPPEVAA